jgi:hypothetical protein
MTDHLARDEAFLAHLLSTIRRLPMKRLIFACVALCLAIAPAAALAPKIEAAVKTFKAVAADSAKVKIFCAMLKVMESMDDQPNPTAEKQIEDHMKQLGADFVAAWDAQEGLNENSPDGKAYDAALDELVGKCT